MNEIRKIVTIWLRENNICTRCLSAEIDGDFNNCEKCRDSVTVVDCPQDRMIDTIGPTLVATGITNDETFRAALLDATNIDRLNLGPVPTIQLNWLQPHEGNIVDFLFRARAFQMA